MKLIKLSLLTLAAVFVSNLDAYTHIFTNQTNEPLKVKLVYRSCSDEQLNLNPGQTRQLGKGLCALIGARIYGLDAIGNDREVFNNVDEGGESGEPTAKSGSWTWVITPGVGGRVAVSQVG